MKNPISYKLLLVFICFQLNLTAQTELPNRKVLLYTQYEAVGERGTYRDYSLIKRVTLGTNLSIDKRKKIEEVIKSKIEKTAGQNLSTYTLILYPDEYLKVIRYKLKKNGVIHHRFRYYKYKDIEKLNKEIETYKGYWFYQSHEVVYEEASLTSMKDTDDFYNEMLDYFKSFFEKDDKDKEKLIKDYKDGFTGTRG